MIRQGVTGTHGVFSADHCWMRTQANQQKNKRPRTLLPVGRQLKYSSLSSSLIMATSPSNRTDRWRAPHQKVMAACGNAFSSCDLRLQAVQADQANPYQPQASPHRSHTTPHTATKKVPRGTQHRKNEMNDERRTGCWRLDICTTNNPR